MKKSTTSFFQFIRKESITLLIPFALSGGMVKATTTANGSVSMEYSPNAYTTNVYPNAITSFTGGGIACGNSVPGMTITFNTAECRNVGIVNSTDYVNVTVEWYDNGATNSTTGGTAVYVQNGDASQTSWTYAPSSVSGIHYYYCIISWGNFGGRNFQCLNAEELGITGITSPNTVLIEGSASPLAVSTISSGPPTCETYAAAAGGTPPYTYVWVPGGLTGSTIPVTDGTYTVIVNDTYDCTTTQSVTVSGCEGGHSAQKATGTSTISGTNKGISIYPNPSNGQFSVTGLNSAMIIEMYDYTGRKINMVPATDNITQVDISKHANGIYLVRIVDKEGQLISEQKLIKTN